MLLVHRWASEGNVVVLTAMSGDRVRADRSMRSSPTSSGCSIMRWTSRPPTVPASSWCRATYLRSIDDKQEAHHGSASWTTLLGAVTKQEDAVGVANDEGVLGDC